MKLVYSIIGIDIIALLQVILQVEPNGQKGLEYVVIAALASSIVALVVYIKTQNKEVKDAYKASASEVKQIYKEALERYEIQTQKTVDVIQSNNLVVKENTAQTKSIERSIEELSEIIRTRLK